MTSVMASVATILLVLLCISDTLFRTALSVDPDQLLNYCLDTKHHKKKPGKEPMLHDQCKPWAANACCSPNTTRAGHLEINHYNFDPNHCEHQTNHKMSGKCMQYFVRDTCFFDCEPSIGPWVVKINRTWASERFKYVPLCASECDAWFEACKDDYTCALNWPKNLSWKDGRSECKPGASCRKIKELYSKPQMFCESVWDDSWRYAPDHTPCMKLSFDIRDNPNRRATQNYLRRVFGYEFSSSQPIYATISTFLLLVTITLIL